MNNKKLTSIDDMIPLMAERIENGGSVSFTPMGISMQPMLRHGADSVVLIAKPDRLKKYDVIFYRRDNGKYILHRIISAKEPYICIGDNQFKKEKGIRSDQIIAVVSSFKRGGKEYSVKDTGYKIYCRIWHYTRPVRRAYRFVRHAAGRVLRSIGIIK